jgi:hypothetical protein
MPKTKFMVVTKFGEMWAKNPENIRALSSKSQGVYVLYDGSMPMYVGMGYVQRRIRNAANSPRRGEMWDHFSWYVLSKPNMMRDVEALLLRALPLSLRSLTGQKGKFRGVKKTPQPNDVALPIKRKSNQKKEK